MVLFTSIGAACGWLYFVLWSSSFYPQLLLNHRRRSVAGLSLDFVALNTTGFFCYAFYTTLLFFYPPAIRAFTRTYSVPPQVPLNDVIFALHGATLCAVAVAQALTFPRGKQRIRAPVAALCAASWILIPAAALAASANLLPWVAVLEAAGAAKVVCSFCKYLPQVLHNRRRRSTAGFAAAGMALDFSGGFFSIAQQALRAVEIASWAPFNRNFAKTFLAAETIFFDGILLTQHFVLYPGAEAIEVRGSMGMSGLIEGKGLLSGRDGDP